MFRKTLIVFSLMLIFGVLLYDSAYTHSGRTDANGGHYNRKTGTYHYHNSGISRTRPSYTPLPNTTTKTTLSLISAYHAIGREMKYQIVNHQEQYVDGDVHTNTIEGFWSLLKRAWYGSHHHYQTAYTPLYVAERCYKYNYRDTDIFWKFLKECL